MRMMRTASVFLAMVACRVAAEAPPPANSAYTASRLCGFADMLLRQHRVEGAFDSYMSARLIQHNQAAKDGRDAAIALVKPIINAPDAHFTISNLIADGNFAFLFYRGTLGGPSQGAAVAELYRLEGKTFAEHWDAFQPIPAHPFSAHPMFGMLPETPPAPCSSASAQDRALVTGFADLLYRRKNVRAAFERFVSPDMIQHDPRLPDGRDAAIAELAPVLSRPGTHITVAHILVCRGFGVIHLRSQYGTNAGHVIFDIMRFDRGRIVEHWDVFQPVASPGLNPRPPL